MVTGWLADLVLGLFSEREDCREDPEIKELAKCLQHTYNTISQFFGRNMFCLSQGLSANKGIG